MERFPENLFQSTSTVFITPSQSRVFSVGLSGENVKPLSDELVSALRTVYDRYKTYLDAFGLDETYLKKKVEMELGTRMIHLKLRCSGIGSEWGKVTVLGTSGLSGSYVEQRA